MQKRFRLSFKKMFDVIESVISLVCQILLLGVVIVGTLGMLTRYLPVSQPIWIGQMAIFLAMWMYFLGFAVAAKREEYIFIEYFYKFFPSLLKKVLDLVLHIVMIGFCIVILVKGWPLQIIQSKMMVTSFPLPQNLFSLPVLISMALILVILVYNLQIKFQYFIDRIRKKDVPDLKKKK